MTQKNSILAPIPSSKGPMATLIKIKNKYAKKIIEREKKDKSWCHFFST